MSAIDLRALLVVALGSAAGGTLRYALSLAFLSRFGDGFPFGTFFINVTGSFLIGVIIELSATRALGVTPIVRLGLATGLCGGYTTFSAFSYEVVKLATDGRRDLAALYAFGSLGAGVLAFYLGMLAARALARTPA